MVKVSHNVWNGVTMEMAASLIKSGFSQLVFDEMSNA